MTYPATPTVAAPAASRLFQSLILGRSTIWSGPVILLGTEAKSWPVTLTKFGGVGVPLCGHRSFTQALRDGLHHGHHDPAHEKFSLRPASVPGALARDTALTVVPSGSCSESADAHHATNSLAIAWTAAGLYLRGPSWRIRLGAAASRSPSKCSAAYDGRSTGVNVAKSERLGRRLRSRTGDWGQVSAATARDGRDG